MIHTYLSLTICPKVHAESDQLVDGRVGALVDEGGREGCEWKEDEASLQAAVEAGAGNEANWPLPCQKYDAEYQVYDL